MKSYLLLPLFFLNILCLPITLFSQEDLEKEHSQRSKNSFILDSLLSEGENDAVSIDPNQIEDQPFLKNYSDPHEIPEAWPNQVERESDTFQAKFFNMLLILALLIGFMMLASWALKRMMRSKMTNLNTAGNIKVLETRYLSPRATLYLVEVRDQNFLIAESPTHVTYLATFNPEQEESSPP